MHAFRLARDFTLKAFIGLGNPGTKYRETRHNIGSKALELFTKEKTLRLKKAVSGNSTAIYEFRGEKILLAVPGTYMNLSGQAVHALAVRHSTPVDSITIIHDDMDLPFGRLKIKVGGGSGGHNGLKSIIEALGGNSFIRIRLGIGRPSRGIDSADYVLERFSPDETMLLGDFLGSAVSSIDKIIESGVEAAMNLFNKRDSI